MPSDDAPSATSFFRPHTAVTTYDSIQHIVHAVVEDTQCECPGNDSVSEGAVKGRGLEVFPIRFDIGTTFPLRGPFAWFSHALGAL